MVLWVAVVRHKNEHGDDDGDGTTEGKEEQVVDPESEVVDPESEDDDGGDTDSDTDDGQKKKKKPLVVPHEVLEQRNSQTA